MSHKEIAARYFSEDREKNIGNQACLTPTLIYNNIRIHPLKECAYLYQPAQGKGTVGVHACMYGGG